MKSLLTFPCQERRLFCVDVSIDSVENQKIPTSERSDEKSSYEHFLIKRAKKLLGEWPVHIVPVDTKMCPTGAFSGNRIYAKCASFALDNPEIIEYGILVWHEREVQITCGLPDLSNLKWNTFAESIEV